jgi:hypothetical protein
MKNHKTVYLFGLLVATSFLIGCSSAANVQNNSAMSANQSKPADPNKNSSAGAGETPKPANAPASSDKPIPVYTDLTEKSCKTTKKNEAEEWMTQICDGVGGYKLEVFEGDLRSSINVIAPGGKKSELDFQQVSGAFSTLGEKAEWRVEKKDGKDVPTALIVRFNASKGDDDTKQDSFLIVSKIAADKSCITDVVKPSANANEEARKLAENAATKPCKTDF